MKKSKARTKGTRTLYIDTHGYTEGKGARSKSPKDPIAKEMNSMMVLCGSHQSNAFLLFRAI